MAADAPVPEIARPGHVGGISVFIFWFYMRLVVLKN